MTRPNLVVLGAAGTVAHGVLTYLKRHRERFGTITLVDKDEFRDDRFIARAELDARAIVLEVLEETRDEFAALLDGVGADIVLDVSYAPTKVAADAAFALGRPSYVCTAYCDDAEGSLSELTSRWFESMARIEHRRPHILFTGMNPGVVNVWAAMGVRKFGRPREFVEFEYDTSRFLRHYVRNGVTWSPSQFVEEMVKDPAQVPLGRRMVRTLTPNPLAHREDLRPFLAPLLDLPSYPEGCTVTHEECLTLARRYDVPCRFLYSVNRQTMAFMEELYRRRGTVTEEDLVVMDNRRDPLVGSDMIGLRLEYDHGAVTYFNRLQNHHLKEASATIYQVCVGVYAALFTLLLEPLRPGVFLPEDLADTYFGRFVTDNLMVEEHVFERDAAGSLRHVSGHPHVDWASGPFLRM